MYYFTKIKEAYHDGEPRVFGGSFRTLPDEDHPSDTADRNLLDLKAFVFKK